MALLAGRRQGRKSLAIERSDAPPSPNPVRTPAAASTAGSPVIQPKKLCSVIVDAEPLPHRLRSPAALVTSRATVPYRQRVACAPDGGGRRSVRRVSGAAPAAAPGAGQQARCAAEAVGGAAGFVEGVEARGHPITFRCGGPRGQRCHAPANASSCLHLILTA
eukprot:scaffold906_cov395-Prasinococcus_capsulatus_cf.AAC.7